MEKLIEKFKEQKIKINEIEEKRIKFSLSKFKYSEEIFNKNDWNLFYARNLENPFIYGKTIIKFNLLNYVGENNNYDLEKKYYIKIDSFLSVKQSNSIFTKVIYRYNDYFSENDLKNNSTIEFIGGNLVKDYFELENRNKIKEDEESFFSDEIKNRKLFEENILCSLYFYDNKFFTEEEFFSLNLIILNRKGSYYHIELNSKKIKNFYNERILKTNDEIHIFSTLNNFYPLIFDSNQNVFSIKNYVHSFVNKKGVNNIFIKDIEINKNEKNINILKSFSLPLFSSHFDCCGAKLAHNHHNLPKIKIKGEAYKYACDLSIFEKDYIFDLIYLFFLRFSFANIFLYLTEDQLYSLDLYKKVFGEDSYKIIHSYYNINSGNKINLIEIITPLKASNFLNLGLNESKDLNKFKSYNDRSYIKSKISTNLFLGDNLFFEIFQLIENLEEKTKVKKSKGIKIVKSKYMQYPVRNFKVS